MQLQPTQRVSVAQAVLDQLLARIRDGSIKLGDRLPGECVLIRQLGVEAGAAVVAPRWATNPGTEPHVLAAGGTCPSTPSQGWRTIRWSGSAKQAGEFVARMACA